MDNCIFCKIIAGDIPCYKIYEDNEFLSFLDIFPRVKGHALVIPKKHYRWTYDVPNFGQYWEVARKVSQTVQATLGARFVSFLTLGEEVPHAHIHILPQYGEGIEGVGFQEMKQISKEELAKMAEEIQSRF